MSSASFKALQSKFRACKGAMKPDSVWLDSQKKAFRGLPGGVAGRGGGPKPWIPSLMTNTFVCDLTGGPRSGGGRFGPKMLLAKPC